MTRRWVNFRPGYHRLRSRGDVQQPLCRACKNSGHSVAGTGGAKRSTVWLRRRVAARGPHAARGVDYEFVQVEALTLCTRCFAGKVAQVNQRLAAARNSAK